MNLVGLNRRLKAARGTVWEGKVQAAVCATPGWAALALTAPRLQPRSRRDRHHAEGVAADGVQLMQQCQPLRLKLESKSAANNSVSTVIASPSMQCTQECMDYGCPTRYLSAVFPEVVRVSSIQPN